MTSYEVGEQVCSPSGDIIQFDMTDNAAILSIRIQNPTKKEKESFKGETPFLFVVVEDVIFILIQLGDTWMDAPYYVALSRNLTKLPDLSGGWGLMIHALLVDATTGILVAQKIFSPDAVTSERLIEAMWKQPSIPNYKERLRSIYSRYTTFDLLEMRLKSNEGGDGHGEG